MKYNNNNNVNIKLTTNTETMKRRNHHHYHDAKTENIPTFNKKAQPNTKKYTYKNAEKEYHLI